MKKLGKHLAHEFMDKDYAHAYMDSHQSTRIATQIKVLREQRGLTQKQLAELSKMKQERISALEDVDYDAWTISTLRKLAHAFDTTLQISFIPFSQGIQDIANFSREHLQAESRETDLKHLLPIIEEMSTESMFKWPEHTKRSLSRQFTQEPIEAHINSESTIYMKLTKSPAANDENYKNYNAA